ncbi:MAG: helicase-associated domain-containing protein [Candidatus Omnitrophota bacterium]
MNLSNLLVHLPHEQLQRLADEFGLSSLTPSKRNLLQALMVRYRDRDFLAEVLTELPASCRRLLRTLVFFVDSDNGLIRIPEELRQAWRGETPLSEQWLILYEKGFLFPAGSEYPDAVMLPDEIRRNLRTLFFSQTGRLSPQGEMKWDDARLQDDALESIFHLLCLLRRVRAKRTQKGEIHKKIVDRWRQRIGIDSGGGDLFAFAFEYCLQKGLLIDRQNKYVLAPSAEDWMAQNEEEMRRDLWRHLLRRRILGDFGFQQLAIVLLTAEKSVCESGGTPLFLLKDLEKEFLRGIHPKDMLQLDPSRSIQESMRRLQSLGLLRMNHGEEPAFHFTPAGVHILFGREILEPAQEPSSALCVLQPNYELLAPPTAEYSILWKLDRMAEFKRRDVMTTFQLTQKSVVGALRAGWDAGEMISFLETAAGGKIPENVRYSLEDWRRKYGRIKLYRTVLVECDAPELADEMLHVPEVKDLLGERVSERHFVLPESKAKLLMRALQERGYEPSAARKLSEED